MNERPLLGAPTVEDAGDASPEEIVEAEIVDAEIVEEAPPRSGADVPWPFGGWLSDRPRTRQRPRPSGTAETPPGRPDFLSWRSAMTAAAGRPAKRRLSWPRLLGFLAAALLFVALVSLSVLVAL